MTILIMGSRRKAREYALQILFQVEFTRQPVKMVLDQFFSDNPADEEARQFAGELVGGCLRNLKEIDHLIEESSTNWKMSRMASVDRNLLREAVFEIVYRKDIPSSVTINEAVEIAKKFGTEESSSFINGILDKIAKENGSA